MVTCEINEPAVISDRCVKANDVNSDLKTRDFLCMWKEKKHVNVNHSSFQRRDKKAAKAELLSHNKSFSLALE